MQRGFLRGRSILRNVLEIDWESMRVSLSSQRGALVLFDFEAAFPSAIHRWIWTVLRHRQLPDDYMSLFRGLYHQASAIFNHRGHIHTLIVFLSGVLQGCPGSVFLFNNVLDPFLFMFDRVLRRQARWYCSRLCGRHQCHASGAEVFGVSPPDFHSG